ncbi:type IX secretion system sortase PorU [Thermophagus sp. OGC60D27]|uniref:type IX secretion system sortase PorU n=1 Tax=Thermophagus sp. OGC60D27 TaxID=3458415 RepID=UPI004037E8F8
MWNYKGQITTLFLLILSGLIFFVRAGANDSVTMVRKIEWQDTRYPELPFKGQGYYQEENGWPVMVSLIPLPVGTDPRQTVVDVRALTWETIHSDKAFSDTIVKKLSPTFNHRLVYIQKKAYVELEIIPFRRINNEEHHWQRLLSYSVSISYGEILKTTDLKSATSKYASNSKLASGKWVKIGTTQKGIYKIPYATLKTWGFSDPEKAQIYGYGGVMVPLNNSEFRPDDLPPIACWHQNNALFFYSAGPWQWNWNSQRNMFEHIPHLYSPLSFYFVSDTDQPLTPQIQNTEEIEADYTSSSYDFLLFHETEKENLLNSGCLWLGEKFSPSGTPERTFTFEIPNVELNSDAMLYTQVAGRSNASHAFNISIDGLASGTLPLATVSLSDYLGYYARMNAEKITFPVTTNSISITYQYAPTSTSSVGWLDYLILQSRSLLTLKNGPIVFRDHLSANPEGISAFHIFDVPHNAVVWDVTNPLLIKQISAAIDGTTLTFKDSTSNIKEYVAFSPDMEFPTPQFIGEIPNQNLHASPQAEMVIVAPKSFLEQAYRLADLHATHSGLSVVVAERDQIYNEFSWGHPDPGAIRGFIKMLYDRAGQNGNQAPRLLLLFGDGSFDNRHIDNTPAAPLPTYQSQSSLYQTASFVTDDFFGFLDDDEGDHLQSDRLDIGIGRFPVNSLEEATIAVDKTEAYLLSQEKGRWKTRLTFVGDDGDNNIHMRDADKLTQKVAAAHPEFDINKIYLDAYPVSSSATGREFPDAKNDIQEAISEGTLIWNYSGHGSESALAHEKILTVSDIQSWINKQKLPLFVTATCEFSRFDNHEYTSAGEQVFLSQNGGGIALLSTTRIVYASLNYTLNNAFYNHVFEYDETGQPLRLGEMMRRTKLESGANTNKLNFTLLGDPALQLMFPPHQISTVELNGEPIASSTDTIKAMSHNTLKAKVTDSFGNTINDFNGTAFITIFDKAVDLQTIGNDGNIPFEYSEYSNILFSGRATVNNGLFEISFVIPQDIRYNLDYGRISYYAQADDGREAFGAYSNIFIGGISELIASDNSGPEIRMYLNHPNFNDGDQTTNRPMLYARLADESGINTSGTGIGHDITLIIDEDKNNPIILNDNYTADIDNFQSGTLQYQLPQMEDGDHTLTLKVWDNYNNSSAGTLNFKVSSTHGINGRNFIVYPNPVKPGNNVYFSLTTDIPNDIIDATIQFMNSAGQVTGTVEEELIISGNALGPYLLPLERSGWNYNGICFVRIILKAQNGKKEQFVAKLLPARQ